MWPWGHAALGYLLYSLLARRDGRLPASGAVVALAVGTQFPDLIDKPLGWTLGLLPAGRSLAHSLLTVAVVVAAVTAVARRYDRPALGAAFGVGYLSHVFADGLYPALAGRHGDLTYLAWPLLSLPEHDVDQSFIAHFALLEVSWHFALEVGLVVLAVVLWMLDGRPGLDLVLSAFEDEEEIAGGSEIESQD